MGTVDPCNASHKATTIVWDQGNKELLTHIPTRAKLQSMSKRYIVVPRGTLCLLLIEIQAEKEHHFHYFLANIVCPFHSLKMYF